MQFFFSLSPALQALLAALVMFLMTSLGALTVFCSRRMNAAFLTLLTGAAAGIMIAASFFSLLLPALGYEGVLPSAVTVTLGFLLGGAFILASDLVLTRTQRRFLSEEDRKCALLYFAVMLLIIPEGHAVGVAFAAVSPFLSVSIMNKKDL